LAVDADAFDQDGLEPCALVIVLPQRAVSGLRPVELPSDVHARSVSNSSAPRYLRRARGRGLTDMTPIGACGIGTVATAARGKRRGAVWGRAGCVFRAAGCLGACAGHCASETAPAASTSWGGRGLPSVWRPSGPSSWRAD